MKSLDFIIKALLLLITAMYLWGYILMFVIVNWALGFEIDYMYLKLAGMGMFIGTTLFNSSDKEE